MMGIGCSAPTLAVERPFLYDALMLAIADTAWRFDEQTNAGPPCGEASLAASGGGVSHCMSVPHTVSGGGTVDLPALWTPAQRRVESKRRRSGRPQPLGNLADDRCRSCLRFRPRDSHSPTAHRHRYRSSEHDDANVPAGAYRYQVAALVDGGEVVRSGLVEVTVAPPNRSPTVVGTLAPLSLRVEDGASSVDVSMAFSDPDGDVLAYGAFSSAPSVARVAVAGSTVWVTPLSGGTTTLTLTATDEDGSIATRQLTVTVENRAPVAVATLPPLDLQVSDGVWSVDASEAFLDLDNDVLTYGATSSVASVASVTVSGSTVTVTPLSGGAATVTVTATDRGGSNTSATQTFTVTVANRAPAAVGTLAGLSLQVPAGPRSVNVSGAFSDPDGDSLTYDAWSSSESVVTVSTSGSAVTVTPVSGGTATITVTAEDGAGLSATQTFEVTVANRSPVAVGTLSPLDLQVSDGTATVTVADAFEDPDGDSLTYGAASSSPSVATVSVSGSTVTVTPVSGGEATVTVTATDVDGSNTSAEQTFAVTVANRPPEAVDTLPPLTRRVADGAQTVAVSGAFRDPDGDVLTYGASSSDTLVARAWASGATVTVTPESSGTATVTVTATDRSGSNMPATQTFRVTVAGNRSPEPVGSLPRLPLRVADGAQTVEVSGAFQDRDDDDLTYEASSSDASVATVSVSGWTVTVTPVSGGTATVRVTATDRGGSDTSTTQTFEAAVENQSPEAVRQLEPLSLQVEAGAESVDVAFAFRDPDADALTYGATSSDTLVVTVSASGSTVTVTPLSGGTATVAVTARDAGGSNTTATRTFEATVANRAPLAVGRLEALLLHVADGVRSVNVSGAFEDPDGDVLTYGAASSSASMATVEVSGSTVRVTPLGAGTTTVTVTASDAGGLQAEQAFEATVVNRSPERVGSLRALSLVVEDGAGVVEVSGAFEDPDGDALTYGAESSAVTVAAVSVSGSTVTVTPLSRGSTTVTVTATDVGASNTQATQTFGVRVTGGPGPQPRSGGGGDAVGPDSGAGEVLSVDVGPSFRDRDGDVLTYAAESATAGVASASVAAAASGVVTVTALSVGEAEVTVTATDAEGSNRSATQTFTVTVTHDADADGLIAVHTLAQLDAVRHDLDGDGVATAAGSPAYASAFGVTDAGTVSCGDGAACSGYELGSDLDFDTSGSGGPDAADAYWRGGSGWLPIGTAAAPFTATFEGNGRVIRHLFIAGGDGVGLFGATGTSGVVRHVGVTAIDVSGANAVGGLAGLNGGLVTGSYATGRVAGAEGVGGLVGANPGTVGGSYAAVQVSGASWVGGLAGFNDGRLTGSYATGRVSGTSRVGGLAGYSRGVLRAGYATGRVWGAVEAGGLVGVSEPARDGHRQLLGHGHVGPSSRTVGRPGRHGGPGPVDAGAAGADRLCGAVCNVERRRGRRRRRGRSVGLRDGCAVSGAVAGRGRRRSCELAGGGPPVAGRPGIDRGAVGRPAGGGADVDGGRGERLVAVAGGQLHGLARGGLCSGDGRDGDSRLPARRPQCRTGLLLHVPGGGGGRRRRGGAQRPGAGPRAVRVYGDPVASGRAVDRGHGTRAGDDGTGLRVDGGERVGVSDGVGGRCRPRLGPGDLHGGGERGRPADGRAGGGGPAGDGVPGVGHGVHGPADRTGGDAGPGDPLRGAAGAGGRVAGGRGVAGILVDGPGADTRRHPGQARTPDGVAGGARRGVRRLGADCACLHRPGPDEWGRHPGGAPHGAAGRGRGARGRPMRHGSLLIVARTLATSVDTRVSSFAISVRTSAICARCSLRRSAICVDRRVSSPAISARSSASPALNWSPVT